MDGLPIWTVYDHPTDLPDYYVARLFIGEQATASVVMSEDIEMVRQQMIDMGLTCLTRHPGDDPKIMETWL